MLPEIEGFTMKELLELSWEKPEMAQIEVTRNCNQKCSFCFRKCCPEINYPNLSFESWQTIIRKLANLGVETLNFSGGESFLYPNFYQLVRWAKQQGLEIIINTNGTFPVLEIADCVDEFIFSIHGIGKLHDEIVDKEDAFVLAEKNISKLSSAGKKVSVNMVLLVCNYGVLNQVFDYFNSRYKIHKFSPTISVRSKFGAPHDALALQMSKELLEDYIAKLRTIPCCQLKLKHGFLNIFFDEPETGSPTEIPLPNCAGGKSKLVIDYDGSVFPCNFFKGEDFYCGNILSGSEYEIWKTGKGFVRFRSLILDEAIPRECFSCLKNPKCFSGCRAWTNKYQEGGFENVRDLRCEIRNAYVGNRDYNAL